MTSALMLSTGPHFIMADSRPPCHHVTSETNVWSEFYKSRIGRVGVFSACVCVLSLQLKPFFPQALRMSRRTSPR